VRTLMQIEAETATPNPRVAVISITEPGPEARLAPGWGPILRLAFHDISRPDTVYKAPSAEDARNILDFLEAIDDKYPVLIVHCHAGISRSGAVARFVSLRHGLPFDPNDRLYNPLLFQLLCEEEDRRTVAKRHSK